MRKHKKPNIHNRLRRARLSKQKQAFTNTYIKTGCSVEQAKQRTANHFKTLIAHAIIHTSLWHVYRKGSACFGYQDIIKSLKGTYRQNQLNGFKSASKHISDLLHEIVEFGKVYAEDVTQNLIERYLRLVTEWHETTHNTQLLSVLSLQTLRKQKHINDRVIIAMTEKSNPVPVQLGWGLSVRSNVS